MTNRLDMKHSILKRINFILLLVVVSLGVWAQANDSRNREIGISFGTSKVSLFESRYSALTKRFSAPSFGFFSRSSSSTLKHEFVFNYTLRSRYDGSELLDYKLHRPDFFFSLQRNSRFGWLGGNINLSTLLTLPSNVTGHYSNAPISYTMAASLGPSISIDRSIGGKDGHLSVEADLHTSLLAYVIRPSYGHPYPDQFLEPGTFTPTREGMGAKLLTSGKIRTIDKYKAIKFRIGVHYLISSNIKIGLSYNIDYVHSQVGKSATYNNQNIALAASYLY